jgi:prephenate dehydrogenase
VTTGGGHSSGERVLILGSSPAASALGRSFRRAGARVDERTLDAERSIDPDITLVVLGVPVQDGPATITRLGPLLPPGAVLLQISPFMIESMMAASTVPGLGERFVPSHFVLEESPAPRASHPAAEPDATLDPIPGATVFLGAQLLPGSAAERVARLLGSLGARPEVIVPVLHDALVALTHHLPILAAAALTLTLRRTGALTRSVAHGAHTVVADATRPASLPSAPSAEVLRLQAPKLIPALENLEREVRRLRHALATGGDDLRTLLEEAREFRRELVA